MTDRDPFDEAGQTFASFLRTIAKLRDPDSGCPWDLKQNHRSLRRYMIEEAYEAAAAMESADQKPMELASELGDVLLQVVLNAQVAKDAGLFTINDVITAIDEKMTRRHPHVFTDESMPTDDVSLRKRWNQIKSEEAGDKEAGVFSKIPGPDFPAATVSQSIGRQANAIEFDWDNPQQVLQQFESEVAELKAEITRTPQKQDSLEEEMGDVYFSLAQLCRHLGLDSETVAHAGNQKFLRRFSSVEALCQSKGWDIRRCTKAQLEALWVEAKAKGH